MRGVTIFTASTGAQQNVSAYPRSDALGAVGVSQRVPRLLESDGSGTDVRDHDRPAVAAQGVLKVFQADKCEDQEYVGVISASARRPTFSRRVSLLSL